MGVGPSLSSSFPMPRCCGEKNIVTGSMAEERVGAPDTTTPWRKTSMRLRCCGEKNIMTRAWLKERVGAPDITTPWRKTSMREEAPGPVAPP